MTKEANEGKGGGGDRTSYIQSLHCSNLNWGKKGGNHQKVQGAEYSCETGPGSKHVGDLPRGEGSGSSGKAGEL